MQNICFVSFIHALHLSCRHGFPPLLHSTWHVTVNMALQSINNNNNNHNNNSHLHHRHRRRHHRHKTAPWYNQIKPEPPPECEPSKSQRQQNKTESKHEKNIEHLVVDRGRHVQSMDCNGQICFLGGQVIITLGNVSLQPYNDDDDGDNNNNRRRN